jgi:hypothetical protein
MPIRPLLRGLTQPGRRVQSAGVGAACDTPLAPLKGRSARSGEQIFIKMSESRPGIVAEKLYLVVDRPERAGIVRWPDPDASGRIARPEERGGPPGDQAPIYYASTYGDWFDLLKYPIFLAPEGMGISSFHGKQQPPVK